MVNIPSRQEGMVAKFPSLKVIAVVAAAAASIVGTTQEAQAGCDTSGFPHANGTVNTSGSTRGAVYLSELGGARAYGKDGRPCSVPLELYGQTGGDSDRGSGGEITPDDDGTDGTDGTGGSNG